MKCRNFEIRELVSRKVFQDRGESAWQLFDPRLLAVIDRLVDKFGACVVNDWPFGGKMEYRGYRGRRDLPKSHFTRGAGQDTYSLDYDQHIHGRAIDCHFKKISVPEVRNYILANPQEFPEIKGIELDVSWLHIDVRNSDKVMAFKP